MRFALLALLAVLVVTPAYADDIETTFRVGRGWDYETVIGESLAKLRPLKKARVRCRVAALDESANIIKLSLKCGAKTFAITFDDAATELAFPRTKPAPTQKLKVQGYDYDVWFVEQGTRAIGFLPGTGPVLLCDSIAPYRCLRLAPLTKAQARRIEALTKADMDRFADLLTSEGDSSIAMSKRRPGAELGVPGSAGLSGIDSGRQGQAAIGPGGGAPTSTKPPEAGPGRIAVGASSSATATSLTPNAALMKIHNHYMIGLKRCYRHALAKDSSLKGTLEIELFVDENGRVKPTIKSATADLTKCVETQARNWRFLPPTDSEGEPTTATLQFSFTLTPE